MKKMFVSVLTVALLLSFSSLLEAKKKTYLVKIKLDKVTREPGMDKEIKVFDDKSFNDELIQIKWMLKSKELKFELFNNSDELISIDWEKSSFKDKSNKEHRITHSGIKPDNMKKVMPPLDIPPKQKIKEMVYPCSYYFKKEKTEVSRGLSGQMASSAIIIEWQKKPIFEKKLKLNKPSDFDFAGFKKDLEKGFEVLLLFKQGDKTYKYSFYFEPEVKEK